MVPHLSQLHDAGFQYAVFWPQQEVTGPKARFKLTLPKKSELDGDQHASAIIWAIQLTFITYIYAEYRFLT